MGDQDRGPVGPRAAPGAAGRRRAGATATSSAAMGSSSSSSRGRRPAPGRPRSAAPARPTAGAVGGRRAARVRPASSHRSATPRASRGPRRGRRGRRRRCRATLRCGNSNGSWASSATRRSCGAPRDDRRVGVGQHAAVQYDAAAVGRSRPATTASTVDLPAPFGPEHGEPARRRRREARRRRRDRRPRPQRSSVRLVIARVRRPPRRSPTTMTATTTQDQRERDRGVGVGLALQVDLERQGAGDALQAAGEREWWRRTRRAPARTTAPPRDQPGQHQRQGDPAKTVVGRAPSVAATTSYRLPGRAQRALEAHHQERQRDERLGEHHGGGGERDLDARAPRRCSPEQPAPAERVEQGDAADHRRQHQRQQHQRAQHAHARETGCEPARAAIGTPKQQAQQRAHGRGLQAQLQRGQRRRGGDQLEEAGPVDPRDHRDQRQDTNRRADRRRKVDPAGQPATVRDVMTRWPRVLPRLQRVRACRSRRRPGPAGPRSPVTRSTNSCARSVSLPRSASRSGRRSPPRRTPGTRRP